MKLALPRRLLRATAYTLCVFALMSCLLLVANKHNYININQYIPYYLAPSFFQPSSDLYIIDVLVNKCFKFNSKNPFCGIPKDKDGEYGDLGAYGGWLRVDKDLELGSSLFNKRYFSYKILKNEAFKNGQLDETFSGEVISDIAVYNAKIDGQIKGNTLKLPMKILDEFRKKDVYDEEDQQIYESHNVEGKLYDEDSHKFKASLGNKVIQEQIDQQQKEELEKGEETAATGEKSINAGKQTEKQTGKQEKPTEEKTGKQEKPTEEKTGKQTEKQAGKAEKVEEQAEKAEEEAQKASQKDTDQEDAEYEAGDATEESPDQKLSKRKVETSLSSLKVHYEIPSKEQIEDNGWRYKDHGIWVKYEPYTHRNGLTGIDVLFGPDAVDPRPNWNLIKDRPLLGVDHSKGKEPYLTFRRGVKLDYQAFKYQKKLEIHKDGKFKILQVADLHFSTGVGKCRDPAPKGTEKGCEADTRTLKFLESVLDIEKPDLVVFTGDQVFGDEAPDSESALFKAVHPVIKRKIPFAATLGNHDDEGSINRNEMMSLLSNLPYSLAANGPEEVSGVGNYVVNVLPKGSKGSAILLYFLDTHKYSQNPKVTPGYDWIKESQLKFVEREFGSFKKQINSYPGYHFSMAFFHIPLPEYRNLNQPFIGDQREGITAPKYNTHARKVLAEVGVKAVSVGHDHCNDYCLMDTDNSNELNPDKMWLCYGGGVGEGGYGGYGGYVRRLRTFELDTDKGEIRTWKRLETDPETKIQEQLIVVKGEVVNF